MSFIEAPCDKIRHIQEIGFEVNLKEFVDGGAGEFRQRLAVLFAAVLRQATDGPSSPSAADATRAHATASAPGGAAVDITGAAEV